ncbi:MAG: hypothetical protein ACYTBJ_00750 [Planctomycetota bacterium]|jgi:hypothetical protein
MLKSTTALNGRLDKLEEATLQMEWQMGLISFEDAFFALIKKQFSGYIERKCRQEEKFQHDPIFGWDDVQQEVYLYLYKWTLEPARKRSKAGKIWLPYVKQSLNNCICNIRRSKANWKMRLNMHTFDITDSPDIAGEVAHEGEYEMEYTEFCEQVASLLSEQERTVYYQLLNPSKKFSNYVRKHSKRTGEVRVTRKIVSNYFDIKYAEVVRMFNNFKTVTQYCSQEI